MQQNSRREFLADVGRGMLAASVGVATAAELGLGSVFAEDGADFPTFGELEPLVSLMQETPLANLQPLLVEKLRSGTDLRTLTAAGALFGLGGDMPQRIVLIYTLFPTPDCFVTPIQPVGHRKPYWAADIMTLTGIVH